ncbi:MAG: hypothetical protein QW350_05285 [Candidatus Aenigmatarchaeota archaeon]|jgi:DNA-directed RNA polymerase beta' subunit
MDSTCPRIILTKQEKKILSEISMLEEESLPELIVENSLITLFDQDDLEKTGILINEPKLEGERSVNDPRMGVTDPYQICATCSRNNFNCPGHLGYIRLNVPIIHPLFAKIVFYVLRSVCNKCGGLLLKEEMLRQKGILQLSGFDRLRVIAEESKNIPCQRGCESNPKFLVSRFQNTGKILYEREKTEFEMTVEQAEKILRSISYKDAEILGFQNGAHPKNLILRNFPVIPPCDRPQIERDEGKIFPDPLTNQYISIIRKNNELSEKKQLSEEEKETKINDLINSIHSLIERTDGQATKGPKNLISIKQRIQGKEALIRGAIMGKRVNYFGRTVLSADPSLKYGQIAIPEEWRPILTRPEVVSSFNQKYLTNLLREGKINYIIKGKEKYKGKIPVTASIRKSYQLEIGDIVDRWMEDGDFVLFGRHPTLHKQSTMGYEIVFKPQRSIGFNPSYAAPHNLDFDGDEGNVHVPQTIDAAIEVREITSAKSCIMNAQNNAPVVGVSYDALSGAYMLTQKDVEIEENLFWDMMNKLTNKESLPTLEQRMKKFHVPFKIVKGKKRFKVHRPLFPWNKIPDPNEWLKKNPGRSFERTFFTEDIIEVPEVVYTGKAAFSALLPPDFSYQKGAVIILDGVLIEGEITKDHIGETQGSIIQALWKDYGPNRAVDFLTDAPFMINRWLQTVSLSVSIRDCIPSDPSLQDKIQSEYAAVKMKIEAFMGKGQIINPIEKIRQEKQIMGQLQDFKNSIVKVVQEYLNPGNSLVIMATSKSKGNEAFIAQILGALGQQFLQNKRIPMTLTKGTRCLPYFQEGETDPASRGFCVSSFIKGLSPAELFFHQTASREGLLDTAIKTSDTGHMFHRIVKSLENLVVSEDKSVRIVDGPIVQFIYGNDGFNPESLESVTVKSGKFLSFVNIRRLATKLNAKYGFYDKQEVIKEEIVVPKDEYEYEYVEEEEEEE